MTAPGFSSSWTKPALRVAAAGLGTAVAGPLGGALGGLLGDALGEHAAGLVGKYVERFGEKAGEKLLETSADSLAERLKRPAPRLEGVYREALRLSLAEIRSRTGLEGFDDWFANWDRCLVSAGSLKLSPITPDQLALENLDGLLRLTLERLDAPRRQASHPSAS